MELLNTIANKVEHIGAGIHCYIEEYSPQIVATFDNRPDVEVALLTPYLQGQVKKGKIDEDALTEMLFTIKRIANGRN